jgi:uncharacterized membrane protein HdeD (DUF308 family)
MALSLRFDDQHLPVFGKNWPRFLILGIALFILGLFAISATVFSTLITIIVLGYLIFFGGAVMLIDTLTFWWGRWGSFFLHLMASLLYLCVGLILIMNPLEGAISLTLLLGIFYTVIGLFRMFFSISSQLPRWGWNLFTGLITFILGILILASWPASSLYIIGLFVGIDLLFVGLTYIMASLAARNITKQLT